MRPPAPVTAAAVASPVASTAAATAAHATLLKHDDEACDDAGGPDYEDNDNEHDCDDNHMLPPLRPPDHDPRPRPRARRR